MRCTIKYIHLNFKSGAKYKTLNNIRSAISKFHIGFSGIPADHLIIKALKAAFRLRPPLPRYEETFDIKPVLTVTKQIFGNNELLDLKKFILQMLVSNSVYYIVQDKHCEGSKFRH